jgi:hypothetical protein
MEDYGGTGPQQLSVGSFLQQLVSHPCAPRLKHLDVNSIGVPVEAAVALLSGLPSLERCSMEIKAIRPEVAPAPSWPQRPSPFASRWIYPADGHISSFPESLQQLCLSGTWGSCIEVDATGLAACSGLTSLQLVEGVRSRNITTAMAACQQLASLSLSVRYTSEEAAAVLAVAAIMPRLSSLSLAGTTIGPQQWQQLVSQGLPGLRELGVERLTLDSSCPAAPSLTSLSAQLVLSSGCFKAGGSAGSTFSLAAILPALKRWEATDCNGRLLIDVPSALRGHPQLTELRLKGMDYCTWRPSWPAQQGLLSGLPQLRKLVLDSAPCSDLEGMLAGCPHLEEVTHETWEDDAREAIFTGAGLEALAGGACSGSLRRLVLDTQLADFIGRYHRSPGFPVGNLCFSVASAAALLRPGALPQLRELQLDVALPPPPEAAVQAGLRRRTRRSDGEVSAHVMQRAERELQAAGAQALACVAVNVLEWRARRVPKGEEEEMVPCGVELRGRAGECAVVLIVWLTVADREAYALEREDAEDDELAATDIGECGADEVEELWR